LNIANCFVNRLKAPFKAPSGSVCMFTCILCAHWWSGN